VAGEIILALLALGILIAGPIAAFIALIRVRALERRIASLETRPVTVAPAGQTIGSIRAVFARLPLAS
jgi:hypothetical protein